MVAGEQHVIFTYAERLKYGSIREKDRETVNISWRKQSGKLLTKIGISLSLKEIVCNISTDCYVCQATEFQLCLFWTTHTPEVKIWLGPFLCDIFLANLVRDKLDYRVWNLPIKRLHQHTQPENYRQCVDHWASISHREKQWKRADFSLYCQLLHLANKYFISLPVSGLWCRMLSILCQTTVSVPVRITTFFYS